MNEPSQPAEAAQRKPFAAFIQEQRGGGLHGELSEGLAAIVAAVQEHRKKGTLALTITVSPNADGLTVTVSDKIKLTAPEGERGAAIYYVDEQHNLTRRNPQQPELPLRELREREVGA